MDECLFWQIQISKLDGPDENSLKELRKFLQERRPLVGLDRKAWDPLNQDDLVVIRRQQAETFVSRRVLRDLVPLYHEVIGKYCKVSAPQLVAKGALRLSCVLNKKPVDEAPLSRTCYYSSSHLLAIIDILGVVISSLLPISSIVALYFVPRTLQRLGIVAGFTAAFSICLKILTEARRIDIFAATAA